LRFLRRLARPFYRATLVNLESVLTEMGDEMRGLAGRINDQGSWAGRQLSDMTGQLERWRERDLHLYHNLVTEITALRLQQTHMQDRINELIRQLDTLKERERALEALTVPTDRGNGPPGRVVE
jgi:chromosome segregation ATPase